MAESPQPSGSRDVRVVDSFVFWAGFRPAVFDESRKVSIFVENKGIKKLR